MHVDLVVTMRRTIAPATPEDEEKMRHLQPGEIFRIDTRKARNGAHHRKFFALVKFVADNHPIYHTADDVLTQLKLRTGHVRMLFNDGGRIIYELKSIDWRHMDEGEFAEWAGRAKQVVFDELFPELTPDDQQNVEQEIEQWLAWA